MYRTASAMNNRERAAGGRRPVPFRIAESLTFGSRPSW